MSLGVPVIGSASGGIPGNHWDAGLVVAEEIARRSQKQSFELVKTCSSSKSCRKMASKGFDGILHLSVFQKTFYFFLPINCEKRCIGEE